jgi:hypothetical protein
MSDVTLFENNALANSELFKSLQDINDNLLSGSTGGIERRRISLNGGKFREIVNGEQIAVNKDDSMNVIIINSAKLSRSYYAGVYDPANPTPPTCWSADTTVPAPEVKNPQAKRCMDCPQNIKGSGQGDTRACRFGQRIAVVLEGQLDRVYQLQLAATSIFGEVRDGKMPMQAYARFLSGHKTPAIAVVTSMRFDEDSSTPKLFFKAVRPLDEDELKTVVALKDAPETMQAITFTVAQTDGVSDKPAAPEKTKQTKVLEAPLFDSDDEDDEPVEAPTKVVKKSAAKKDEEDSDLSAIIDNWDD